MGIVLGKISDAKALAQNLSSDVKPPVPGAVRLTPLEMNMLHFGSDRHSRFRTKHPPLNSQWRVKHIGITFVKIVRKAIKLFRFNNKHYNSLL